MKYKFDIKENFEMETEPANIKQFELEWALKFAKAVDTAYYKLNCKVAEELGVSNECADKFIQDHFIVFVDTVYPNGLRSIPSFVLVAEPKTVEEIQAGFNNKKFDWDCEKQLLED